MSKTFRNVRQHKVFRIHHGDPETRWVRVERSALGFEKIRQVDPATGKLRWVRHDELEAVR